MFRIVISHERIRWTHCGAMNLISPQLQQCIPVRQQLTGTNKPLITRAPLSTQTYSYTHSSKCISFSDEWKCHNSRTHKVISLELLSLVYFHSICSLLKQAVCIVSHCLNPSTWEYSQYVDKQSLSLFWCKSRCFKND